MKTFLTFTALLALAACVEQTPDPRPGAEFSLVYRNCERITGATGKYIVGPKGTNGVPVIFAGDGGNLRGEILMNTCIAQNLGTSVATLPPAPQKTPKGKLPLPTQYPLLPGDAELWASLTLEQQQRALLFLKDGGTIRSSLRFE